MSLDTADGSLRDKTVQSWAKGCNTSTHEDEAGELCIWAHPEPHKSPFSKQTNTHIQQPNKQPKMTMKKIIIVETPGMNGIQ